MKEIEAQVEEKVGRGPDARTLASVWTEEGWERVVEMYWVSPDQQEVDALRSLAESRDEPSVNLGEMENDGDRVVLLSCAETSASLLP